MANMNLKDALNKALKTTKQYIDKAIEENGFSGDYNDLENRPCYDERNYDVIECPEIFDGDISDRIVVDTVASAAISNEEDNVSAKGLAVVPRYVKISDIAPDLGIPMDNPETFMETFMDMMHKELIQIEVCYWDEGVEKTQKGMVTFDYDYIPEIGDYGFIDYYLKLTDMNDTAVAYFVYEEFTYESWGQSLSLTPGVWLIYGVEPNEDYTSSDRAAFYGKTYTIKKYKDGELKELPSKYVNYKPGLRLDGQVIDHHGEELTAGMYAEVFNAVENNIAIGTCSHAEGLETNAIGDYSHAEGSNTTANGNYSHAEGESTYANGDGSHAEGYCTSARGEAQHVQGKFNIYDNDNKYAHIVGNGDWSARSNAHTLDWNGNAWFQGNVSTDGTPTNDKDLVTKKYVDDAIPSIEGLATNFELNEMMLHQSVNFSELFEEKILINVNTKGNHTVYAPEDNGDTTKALKRYMNIDQDLSSVNYGDYFMIDYREQNTPMTNLIFYKWGEFADKSRLISHVLEICVNNTRVQILTRLIKDMQSTAEGTLIDAPGKCTLQLTLSKTYNTPEIATIFDAMQVIIRFLKPHFLPLDNKSFEYTPTEDYQPATKKYVDDTIEENGFSGDYNDLENKPCYDDREFEEIEITFDGDIEGKETVLVKDPLAPVSLSDVNSKSSDTSNIRYVKASDKAISYEEFCSVISLTAANISVEGELTEFEFPTEELKDALIKINDNVFVVGYTSENYPDIIITHENITVDSVIGNIQNDLILTPGIWFLYYNEMAYINKFKYQGIISGELKKLDEKYLPDSIANGINVITEEDLQSIFDSIDDDMMDS